MIAPGFPQNEATRLKALRSLNILDTDSEAEYDSITQLAAYISGAKVSLVSLIDEERQWFKSKIGTELCGTSREHSFCGHAILQPNEFLIVPDATKDVRFQENPLTTNENPVIFYAGFPLVDNEGHAMGTLCVLDNQPSELNENQVDGLKLLAKQVEKLLELRKRNIQLRETRNKLEKHNNLLKNFAGVVSHDMKMPLANLILTSDILRKEYESKFDQKGVDYLSYLKKTSLSLSDYIGNILDHYESTAFEKDDSGWFELNAFLEDIVDMLDIQYDCEVHLPEENHNIFCNDTALKQIFINLITNSLKYNDKDQMIIQLGFEELENHYKFSIEDNGMGIEAEKIAKIFDLFETSGQLDRHGNKGHGIGLSTVKKLVEALGGEISISSTYGKGTKFDFTIEKIVLQ